ncbi:hypothetical protein LBMAG57_30430 [Verrucomicrobiota bacterium]|nr:hypothetical protein LBMAG57_30430 [Verrucomicrobiota bacterium]
MKLAITICATRDYLYAMPELAVRIQANLAYTTRKFSAIHLILSGDESPELEAIARKFSSIGRGVEIHTETQTLPPSAKNYDKPAQMMIAAMRTRAFTAARGLGADACWSLDSDVLPPENALECMMGMLEFDRGYYGVAACPYPSQGGGDFLGGRGTPQRPILPDVFEEERVIPKRMSLVLSARRERVEKSAESEREKEWKKLSRLEKRLEKMPPKGNIFERLAQAKEWKRRGWLSSAYPAIGLGAVVPSDWCGMGCTLMGHRALASALLEGYRGEGTEDLYIVWRHWFPKGIRIACITHAPCDHVIRERMPDGTQDITRLRHIQAFHEGSGECVGHLRTRSVAFGPLESE